LLELTIKLIKFASFFSVRDVRMKYPSVISSKRGVEIVRLPGAMPGTLMNARCREFSGGFIILCKM
jgi:hypothetical protein